MMLKYEHEGEVFLIHLDPKDRWILCKKIRRKTP